MPRMNTSTGVFKRPSTQANLAAPWAAHSRQAPALRGRYDFVFGLHVAKNDTMFEILGRSGFGGLIGATAIIYTTFVRNGTSILNVTTRFIFAYRSRSIKQKGPCWGLFLL